MPITEVLKSIPASYRRILYTVYAVALFIAGAIQVALDPDPQWLLTTFDVLAYIGIPVGGLAAVNAGNPGPPPVPEDNQPPV